MTRAETEHLQSTYAELGCTTGRMLDAALEGRWEDLVALERQCAELIATMSRLETEDPLPEGVRASKVAMIRKVLADDAAIRNITEPWLQQLGSMLGANRHSQRLLRTYGPAAAGD